MNRKGNVLGDFTSLAIGVASVILVLVLAFLFVAEGRSQLVDIQGINESAIDNFTSGYNATVTMEAELATIPGWLGLFIIAFVFVAILGIVKLLKRRT